ncbi:hypothetical protein Tco_0384905 [Tanacetum coccineum]
MRRKERVTENVLDVVIQIISLAIVQNNLATKIKRRSLEALGAIARMKPKIKPTTKLVSWLSRQMRSDFVITRRKLIHNSIEDVRIKRLLEVTTAQVNVTAVKQNTLMLLVVNTASTKVNAAGLQLLEELLLSEG